MERDKMREFLVHGGDALPLYLDEQEADFGKTYWFRALVSKLRLDLSGAMEGEWLWGDFTKIVSEVYPIKEVNLHTFHIDTTELKKSYESSEGDSLARRFCKHMIDCEYDKVREVLVDWVWAPLTDLYNEVFELQGDSKDGFVLAGVVSLFTHDKSTLHLKFEYRGDSNIITQDEGLEIFIDDVIGVVNYWGRTATTPKEAADGAAFSILNVLDGCGGSFQTYDLIPCTSEDDKLERIMDGADYYEEDTVINASDMLHEKYCEMKKR